MSFRTVFVALFVGGVVLGVACVDGEQVVPAADAGGKDSTTGGDSGNDATAGDASDDAATDDAGIVTDGGNPDEDGGVVIDAGSDAGTCGPPSANAPNVNSNCSSLLIIYLGGTVQPGNYNLVSFTVQGTVSYCGTYVPAAYSGRLVVKSSGGGKFSFDERITKSNVINFLPNKSFDVTPTAKVLNVVQTCGLKVTDAIWSYSTGTIATDAGSKNYILYTRTTGTSTVRYRWVQE